MVQKMDEEGFGNCTVTGSCEAVCPKEIPLDFIARMNREYGCALIKREAPFSIFICQWGVKA